MSAEPTITIDPIAQDARLMTILQGVGEPPRISTRTTKKLQKRQKEWVLRFVAELPSPKMAGELIGCSAHAIHRERWRDPEFRRRYDEAISHGRETVAGLVYEEAYGVGHDHVVVKEGGEAKVLAVPKARSEKLLELVYKLQHAPEFQTHSVSVEGKEPPGSLMLMVTPDQLGRLSRSERRNLTQLLTKLESLAPATLEHQP